jgi:hypothetical protein
MSGTNKQELLRRAAALIGHESLALRLNVPPSLLQAWIDGQASMPDRKLRKLADVLAEISRQKG